MEELERAKEKADILFELLAYGLLVIAPEGNKAAEENADLKEVISKIYDEYGKEVIEEPKKILGLLSDYSPSLTIERKHIRMLFEVGVFERVKANGIDDLEEACVLAENELGFEKETTKTYIKYFEKFYV